MDWRLRESNGRYEVCGPASVLQFPVVCETRDDAEAILLACLRRYCSLYLDRKTLLEHMNHFGELDF